MRLVIASRYIQIFPSESRTAPLIVLNAAGNEWEAVHESIGNDASLAVIANLRWNDDLSPWAAGAVFRGGSPFGGMADEYIELLSGTIVPYIVESSGMQPAYTAIAGYSLAGLFALYAAYRTDIFSRIASVSGSLWYPGFSSYAESHAMVADPERIYFSIGDREAKTSNPYMRIVEEETHKLSDMYRERGIRTVFEKNPGNHFHDASGRIVKGIRWLIR